MLWAHSCWNHTLYWKLSNRLKWVPLSLHHQCVSDIFQTFVILAALNPDYRTSLKINFRGAELLNTLIKETVLSYLLKENMGLRVRPVIVFIFLRQTPCCTVFGKDLSKIPARWRNSSLNYTPGLSKSWNWCQTPTISQSGQSLLSHVRCF